MTQVSQIYPETTQDTYETYETYEIYILFHLTCGPNILLFSFFLSSLDTNDYIDSLTIQFIREVENMNDS